jgi:hypothetical protein
MIRESRIYFSCAQAAGSLRSRSPGHSVRPRIDLPEPCRLLANQRLRSARSAQTRGGVWPRGRDHAEGQAIGAGRVRRSRIAVRVPAELERDVPGHPHVLRGTPIERIDRPRRAASGLAAPRRSDPGTGPPPDLQVRSRRLSTGRRAVRVDGPLGRDTLRARAREGTRGGGDPKTSGMKIPSELLTVARHLGHLTEKTDTMLRAGCHEGPMSTFDDLTAADARV